MKLLVYLIGAMTLAVCLGIVASVHGIEGNPVTEATVTVSSSAVSLTDCADNNQNVLAQVLTNQIYYRLDSSSATPDSGDYLGYVGQIIELEHPRKFRAIRVGSDAAVKMTCFK